MSSKKFTKTGKPNNSAEYKRVQSYCRVVEFYQSFTRVLPLSEQLRRSIQQQLVRAVFKSETTLRSQLVRPKETVDPA